MNFKEPKRVMQALQTPQCQPTHTGTFDQNYCHATLLSSLWVLGAQNTSKNAWEINDERKDLYV